MKILVEEYNIIVQKYNKGLSTYKLSFEYKVAVGTIRNILLRQNVIMRTQQDYRTYDLNQEFFDIIDTEEKAYWIGFIIGDGHNNESKNIIEINLRDKGGEKELLNSFHKHIGSNSPIRDTIKDRSNQIKSLLCSKYICKTLLKHGINHDKSYTAIFPEEIVPVELWKHTIRGLFDTDGSIYFKSNTNGKNFSPVFNICGTLKLVTKVQEIMIDKIDLTKTKIEQNSENCYSFRYQGTRQVIKIRDWLYKDATVYLRRKHDRMFSFEYEKRGKELLEIDIVKELYDSGESTRNIASRYGVNKNTITDFLRENNIRIREKSEVLKSVLEDHKEEVIAFYKEGSTTEKIGDKFGVTPSIVLKFLRRWDISVKDPHAFILEGHEEEIIEMREKENMSFQKIANKFNVSKYTVNRFYKKITRG